MLRCNIYWRLVHSIVCSTEQNVFSNICSVYKVWETQWRTKSYLWWSTQGNVLQVRGAKNHSKFSFGIGKSERHFDVVGIYEKSLVFGFFRSWLAALNGCCVARCAWLSAIFGENIFCAVHCDSRAKNIIRQINFGEDTHDLYLEKEIFKMKNRLRKNWRSFRTRKFWYSFSKGSENSPLLILAVEVVSSDIILRSRCLATSEQSPLESRS